VPEIKCSNKNCNRLWWYKGKAPFYATCPACLRKVNISKNRTGRQQLEPKPPETREETINRILARDTQKTTESECERLKKIEESTKGF